MGYIQADVPFPIFLIHTESKSGSFLQSNKTPLRGNRADLVVWLSGTCIKLHTRYTKNLLIVMGRGNTCN